MPKFAFDTGAINAFRNARKADPQVIGEELDRITIAHDNRLDPEVVVSEAKPARSVLHKFFEWNDEKAAHQHRLDQARHLIAAIKIVADEETGARMTRGFLSISDDRGRSYHRLETVLTNSKLQLRFLLRAEADLESFIRRHAELKDVCDLVRDARERIRQRMIEMELRPQ